jgi:BirA family biotin operon repressor/biotin-[acetyl-CoA-carboxylase] ligase
MDPLDHEAIGRWLTTRWLGKPLVCLVRTGSTNDVARDLALAGAPGGTVVVADEQERGRGRMGRRWLAPAGTCLLCSILLRPPDLLPERAAQLTMLTALAAADAVAALSGLTPSLKWPNDLIVERCTPAGCSYRKLAGLLTETGLTAGRLDYAIVGLGINVNVPAEALPALAPDATSLLAETRRPLERAWLLAALLAGVEARYERLEAGESPFAEWAARLVFIGQPVEAWTPTGRLTGVAEGVDEDGALRLRLADGRLERLLAADVSLRAAAQVGEAR